MNKQVIIGVSAGGGILLLLIIFIVIAAMASRTDPNSVGDSSKLESVALEGATIEDKEKAAADLARSSAPDATDALLRLLQASGDAEVLICVMDGLGDRASKKGDVKARECMQKLVEILEDPKGRLQVDDPDKSKRIRARACVAIVKITGADFGWDIAKNQEDDEQIQKLKDTVDNAKFYISHPPPSLQGGG